METIAITIKRPDHAYDILLGTGLAAAWRTEVENRVKAARYLALVDANLAAARGFPASGSGDGAWRFLWVEPGEPNKTFAQYQSLCEQALALGIDRRTVIVALGGGVTGDIAGFVAATLLRGLRLVQIPTTLLAQVDSSVGGKNGINAGNGKNMVGTFLQPESVLIDPAFLETLPRREYLAGLAEVVKTAVLGGREFFESLERSGGRLLAMDHSVLVDAIARSCRVKAAVVEEDELDTGRRFLLNLGHTFGHALEALAGYDGRVVHGEAVAVGLALASRFSHRKGMLPAGDLERIIALLAALGLPTAIEQLGRGSNNPPDWTCLLARENLIPALLSDKKKDKDTITLVLPRAIGDCRVEKGYAAGEVADFMRERAL